MGMNGAQGRQAEHDEAGDQSVSPARSLTARKPNPSRRQRSLRWIMNPIATLLLGTALVLDAANLPWHWTQGGRSTVGWWVCRLRGGLGIHSQPPYYDALAVKELQTASSAAAGRDGVRILQPHIESMDEATRLLQENPATVAHVVYQPSHVRSGFWAITREGYSHAISISGGSALTPEDRLAARRAMLEAVFGEGALRDPDRERVSREDFSGSRVIWGGVAHNVLAFAGFLLLCLSLGWIPAYWAAAKRRRARSALWRGECPGCGYSLLGLSATVCPECGREVKDPGAGPGS